MSDKKGRGVSNLPVKIQDVPDAPTVSASNVGTSRAYNNGAATVTLSSPTGGLPTSYTVTSTPGSLTGSGTSPVTVTGLSSATSYTFTATATNVSATSPVSSASNSITATTVPQAPTSITFTDGGTGTSGTLTWSAGATGGSTITGYKYSTDGINYTSGSSPASLTGLSIGDYTFYVKATNANGDSLAGTGAGSVLDPSAVFLIQRITATGGETSIIFNSIPGTYKNLQLRIFASYVGSGNTSYQLQMNSDTSSSYVYHGIWGNGTSAIARSSGASAKTAMDLTYLPASNFGYRGAVVADVIDYASTTKYKTLKEYGGHIDPNNPAYQTFLNSGLWMSTSAITSLTLSFNGSTLNSGSTFAVYGMKG